MPHQTIGAAADQFVICDETGFHAPLAAQMSCRSVHLAAIRAARVGRAYTGRRIRGPWDGGIRRNAGV